MTVVTDRRSPGELEVRFAPPASIVVTRSYFKTGFNALISR